MSHRKKIVGNASASDSILARLPSTKSLLIFNVVAEQLNLVRASEIFHLTPSALSRQIKGLESYLGYQLFHRKARGLSLTPEGELLFDHSKRALALLEQGLGFLTGKVRYETLLLSVARSFAMRVLTARLPHFLQQHPDVDIQIDTHRYYADLAFSGADVSIRLGDGNWPGYTVRQITDDRLILVCAKGLEASVLDSLGGKASPPVYFLENKERPTQYAWNQYCSSGRISPRKPHIIYFNDSATLLSAVEEGVGYTVTRACLAEHAITAGRLASPVSCHARDGMAYYAVSRSADHQSKVQAKFLRWLSS